MNSTESAPRPSTSPLFEETLDYCSQRTLQLSPQLHQAASRIRDFFRLRSTQILPLLFLILALTSTAAQGQDYQLPADGRTVDITQPPYNADNTGSSDVTAVINQAIRDGNANTANPRLIYFPKGTYRVSGTIEWKNGSGEYTCCVTLWGANKDQTVIELAGGASGFGNSSSPRSGLYMGSLSGGNAEANSVGGGNKGFFNFVQNLTVDVGSNAGAVGIDLMAHNTGGLRNVKIVGQGHTGLSMERPWPGPSYVKDVEIDGFDYGIRIAERDYGMTLENVTLRNQNVLGIRSDQNLLWIRNLTSNNRVPAVRSTHSGSQTVIVGSSFSGGASSNSAIENESGVLYVRDLSTSGYGQAITNSAGSGRDAAGPTVSEFTSHQARTLFDTPSRMLNLPIEETPSPYWSNNFSDDWAVVTDYGAQPNDGADDAPGIQRAIDSGKPFVYLPPGVYHIAKSSAPIRVRGSVRKIFSMYSYMQGQGWSGSREAVFEVTSGSPSTVEIQGLWFPGNFGSNAAKIQQATGRTLVVRDAQLGNPGIWNDQSGAGDLFLENVGGRFRFETGQNVWARQLDPEGSGANPSKVYNSGGNLWILGIKSERRGTLISTRNGGRTEVLGGLMYPVESVPSNQPLFEVIDADMSAVMSSSVSGGYDFNLWVRQTENGQTQQITRDQLPRRSGGTHMPLYAGGFTGDDPEPTPSPNAPPSVEITQPTDGTERVAPATFTIEADASDSDGSVAEVTFFANGTELSTDQSAPFSHTWEDVPAGSYSLTARALDDEGASTESSSIEVTVQTDDSGGDAPADGDDGDSDDGDSGDNVPTDWASRDIGAIEAEGSTSFDDDTFTLEGAGADIWQDADAFHFTHQSLSGDGELVAQVTSQTNTDPWAKAGVMIRASLESDAPHALMLVSPENGLAFQHRETEGEQMEGDNITIVSEDNIADEEQVTTSSVDSDSPYWVRVVRQNDTMIGYASSDGSSWTEVGRATVPMAEDAFIGLAVTSHEPGTLSTVTFENVSRSASVDDGDTSTEEPVADGPRVSDALEVLYDFSSGSGSIVRDRSGSDAPLDLTIATPDAVAWNDGRLTVTGSASITSDGPADRLTGALADANAVTVEAWIEPANTDQDGPARIVTLSQDLQAGNFTLGQGRWGDQPTDVFDMRLRTTDTDASGRPSVTTPSGTATTGLQHVVYTRASDGTAVLYVNGEEAAREQVSGTLSGWDEGYRLALANELTGDRPWRGALHLVAAYSRALSADEVQTNFQAGPDGDGEQALASKSTTASTSSAAATTVEEFGIDQNYPNPFQSRTTIEYRLPENTKVTVEVFDVLGRRVALLVDEQQPAGAHRVVLDANQLPSGTYLYRIKTPTQSESRRMVLVR